MTDELRVVLAILAVYRLSQLITKDGIFEGFRRAVGRRANGGKIRRMFAELVHCPYCMGVWFALFATLAMKWVQPWSDALLIWLGIAGGQALLEELSNAGSTD